MYSVQQDFWLQFWFCAMKINQDEAAMLGMIQVLLDDNYQFSTLLIELHLSSTLRERMPVPSGRFRLHGLSTSTSILRF